MNWDNGTGTDARFDFQRPTPMPLAHGSVSGDREAPGIETPAASSTGESGRALHRASTSKAFVPSRGISARTARKRLYCLQACLEELERLRDPGDDPMLRSNSLAHAQAHLRALWEQLEGNPHSEAFEEIVHVVEVALCVENADALSPRQLDAVRSVLRKLHADSDVDDCSANDLTEELIEGGIDVFREIR